MQQRSPIEMTANTVRIKDPDLALRALKGEDGDVKKIARYLDDYFSRK